MGSSVVETTGKKKLSGTAKGYIILVGLVVLSWAIFKVLLICLRLFFAKVRIFLLLLHETLRFNVMTEIERIDQLREELHTHNHNYPEVPVSAPILGLH